MKSSSRPFLWILFLGVSGCSGVPANETPNPEQIVDRYFHDLRWQIFDGAANRVEPSQARAYLDELEARKDLLFVTDYELRSLDGNKTQHEIKARVRVSYYLLPSTVVKQEVIDQVWKEINRQWFLVTQKGGPLPALPFPAPADAPTPP